ncbi:MAG: imidazole glycerol phosphate synthase subunit HisH, partial [Clostridia bacterium]|nr:imidazole glycerol phosphate synthase subunit HisH [Clostridia bacterium]
MIAIIDYGVGNLFSLKQSLNKIGAECIVTAKKDVINSCDKIILPGVGAFGDAIANLRKNGLDLIVLQQCANGKPLLGICLGMQLLFEKSYEYGEHEGLGLIKGNVEPLADYVQQLKIPHMGWNSL